jgi:hypothetical protein
MIACMSQVYLVCEKVRGDCESIVNRITLHNLVPVKGAHLRFTDITR